MQVHLIYPIHTDHDPRRELELRFCETANRKDARFAKLTIVTNHPTYDELLALCEDGFINVFCNSDIVFHSGSVEQIRDNIKPGEAWALSRWDYNAGRLSHWNRKDSQDCWCIPGVRRKKLKAGFLLGRPGCDNRFAHCLVKAGYRVWNQSKTVKTVHFHDSNVRRYGRTSKDAVPPPYHFVEPVHLHEIIH